MEHLPSFVLGIEPGVPQVIADATIESIFDGYKPWHSLVDGSGYLMSIHPSGQVWIHENRAAPLIETVRCVGLELQPING